MIKDLVMSFLFSCVPFKKIKKWIYPKKEFLEDIEVDVRSTNPVSFNINSDIPNSRIYLKITNKSQYLEIVFNRAIISVWLSSKKGTQPICHESHIISKENIGKKKTEEIFCTYDLNEAQIKILQEIKDSKRITSTLYIKIYIDSLMYNFMKEVRLENKPCEIN
jgi:hypothetical protein